MAANRSLDIFCDNCGNWEHAGGLSMVWQARRYVQKNYPGWKTKRIDGRLVDLCPGCETIRQPDAPTSIDMSELDDRERMVLKAVIGVS